MRNEVTLASCRDSKNDPMTTRENSTAVRGSREKSTRELIRSIGVVAVSLRHRRRRRRFCGSARAREEESLGAPAQPLVAVRTVHALPLARARVRPRDDEAVRQDAKARQRAHPSCVPYEMRMSTR